MASGRTLGSRRVLGQAKTLSPVPPSNRPPHQRNLSVLSPSESSISSQPSTPPASTAQDLAANVSLGQAAAASASSRLVCPICNEEMVTLLQLNRHLDDLHANLEEVQQDEVKDWFQAQMDKAKKFQPLAVLNQKFKALDVFESNDPPPPPIKPSSGHSTPEPSRIVDPEESVTRKHWQRPSYNDTCLEPTCGKRLGGANGTVNCRKCGKLFCDEHTMYQMKLSRSAQHEPTRGVWCRVCETCYKSREGYNDHKGLERNHMDEFAATRRKTVDKQYLEVSRLEKRLSKLTALLANPPPEDPGGGSSILWPLTGAKTQQRSLEQTVVAWEDDVSVPKCPFCQQEFSTYTFRRHHCRTCGRVVCGDPRTDCSASVGLNVAAPTNTLSEKGKANQTVSLDVRICKDCRHTLFSKADFDKEISTKPADQRSYENLVQFERGIRLLLPKFQKLLQVLQNPDESPTHEQVMQATKVRKRLTDSFVQYESAARRIRDLQTTSKTQERLQKALYQQASTFLQLHMLPLKSLPKILKHATPHGASSRMNGATASKPNGGGALASLRYNDLLEVGSQASSTRSSAIESMEAEEKELRERLIVLEEQKFMVSEMLGDARKKRRFDEVQALSGNVDDLTKEIDNIQGQLAGLDFAGVYANGTLDGTSTPTERQ